MTMELHKLLVPVPRKWSGSERWTATQPGLAEYAAERRCSPDQDLAKGGSGAGLQFMLDAAVNAALGPQGYRLAIEADSDHAQVRLRAGSAAGARHGIATILQLLKIDGKSLPVGSIEDAPAFASRGLMLDVSRNRVPTMAHLEHIVDTLATLKFNHLQLYTEHTFAYAGHEEVWSDASPLTPDEIRRLDAYARRRGIELAANQNCFGHLAVWLKHDGYQHLAEIEGDNVWKFMRWDRRGPFSLYPILPESEAFVRDLLGQLLPCFSSRLVNIGCDETFDVGHGRSRAAVERLAGQGATEETLARARASLFFDFVNTICRVVREHGKRPMVWADIAMSHPDMLDRLSKDVVGLAWGYEPDARFAEECRHLRGHGLEAWVCPGTSTWRTFTGRTTEARANIAAAATQGLAEGATGFLVCDWGDVGHMQVWPLTLARLADAAAAAWTGSSTHQSPEAVSRQLLDDPSGRTAAWIDAIGDVDLPVRRAANVRNAAAMFNDLFPPVPPAPGERGVRADAELWAAAHDRLSELPSPASLPTTPLIRDELSHAAGCSDFALRHAISVRAPEHVMSLKPEELHARALSLLDEHQQLWTRRSRPGGLAASCAHWRRVADSLAG